MWIKICGNTRLQDCQLASDLGADAVGFIFAQGKRTVTAEQVATFTSRLPPALEKIGVFTSTDAQAIAQTAEAAGLTGIQLHGAYDVALVRQLRSLLPAGRPMRLLQVVHWDVDLASEGQLATFADSIRRVSQDAFVDGLLVDSRSSQGSGGTGRTFDWIAAGPTLGQAGTPVIIAGGLTPDNVQEAAGVLHPWGVDISSGIEDSPGVKNAAALRRFVENARQTTVNLLSPD